MKTRVAVAPQVKAFVKSLAPEPRRALTLAIKALARDEGDRKVLEGKLAGYHRLRVTGYRVIYAERAKGGTRILDCLFVERRGVVYRLFLQMLLDELAKR